MKKQLIRAAATSVLGLSLMTGIAAADINTTGPDSSNNVTSTSQTSAKVANDNTVKATNNNTQRADTGNAAAHYNTTAGDASTGSSYNDNSFSGSVAVSNDSSTVAAAASVAPATPMMDATISNTGPGSDNTISTRTTSDLTVRNDNNLQVTNNNSQTASTGDATVTDNTTGGSATTGDASNSSSSSFDFSVSN